MESITSALVDIQNKLKAPKSQHNDFGNYYYRSLEDITEAVKPYLKEHNCVLVFGDELTLIGDRYYVKATATLSNGEGSVSTSAMAREPLSKKGMDESQITGTASSYARKYAANGLFALDDTKDADTNEHHDEVEASEKKAKSTSKKRASTANSKASTDSDNAEERKELRQKIIAYGKEHGMTNVEIARDYKLNNDSSLAQLQAAWDDLNAPAPEQQSVEDEFAAIDEAVPF